MPYRYTTLLVALCSVAAVPLAAQTNGHGSHDRGGGTLHGRVVNQAGQPLAMVEVRVESTPFGTDTDLNGRYSLPNLPVGTYQLSVRLIGYQAKTVTGVEVGAAGAARLDVTMSAAAVEIEAVEVTATLERGSAAALLEERRAANVVVDAIGAQQISRSPDSDAAQALKRVTGLSVVGGRYVYVRGLGDRYSSASLNGVPLPSPEPDRRAVPLDVFPATLLESVTTSKTYSPDQPGDYAGGLLDIRTKNFPGTQSVRVSFGTSANSQTTFQNGISYDGGGRDWLGFDDGSRRLPSEIPADVKVIDSELSTGEIETISEAFPSVWQPQPWTVPMNASGSLSFADETRLLGMPAGVLASATYSNSYESQELIERILVTAAQDEEPETDYTGTATKQTVRWSALGKFDLLLTPANQLTVRSLYTRTAEDLARQLEGFNRDRNTDLRNMRLQFLARSVWTNNLEAEHYLGALGGWRLNWRTGYSVAAMDEPDRRDMVYERNTAGEFVWRELTNSATRRFTDLDDRDLTAALDLTIPVGSAGRVKVGGQWLDKEREFFHRRFRFREVTKGSLGTAVALPPDQLFSGQYIGGGQLAIQEDTRRTDNYTGTKESYAGYVMADVPVASSLRISGGVRLERVQQKVLPKDLFPLGLPPVDSAVIDNTDLLPGINLTWSLGDRVNLRAGLSQTVARPEFREQAEFDFVDFTGGFLIVGNPALERTLIRNYDLRWEWFPALGNLIAVSGFVKRFENPIEAVVFPSSELIATWDNNESADVYGAEFEVRTSLGLLTTALQDVSFVGNASFVHSVVESGDSLRLPGGNTVAIEPRTRALQGQSPYVVNLGLTYLQPVLGTSLTVLYNRFGRRIDKVGTQVLPDVFEQPRDQLDLVLEQPLGAGARVKATVSNALDEASEFKQAGQVVRRSTLGRVFSVSFSFGTP